MGVPAWVAVFKQEMMESMQNIIKTAMDNLSDTVINTMYDSIQSLEAAANEMTGTTDKLSKKSLKWMEIFQP